MPRLFLVALALTFLPGPARTQALLTLEVRVFDGAEEVTADTRVAVHRAGERTTPVAETTAGAVRIPPGLYDVQAIRESGGRVVNIRWAERLAVMAYPDEGGRHLEVVNFQNGYGALQVRTKDGASPLQIGPPIVNDAAAPAALVIPVAPVTEVTLHASGVRDKEAAAPVAGADYLLFVVPAGRYDVQTRTATRPAWHTDIDVPLDRTRLWLVQ